MQRSQMEPDVISYNAAISASEKGQQCEQALGLRQQMWRSQM